MGNLLEKSYEFKVPGSKFKTRVAKLGRRPHLLCLLPVRCPERREPQCFAGEFLKYASSTERKRQKSRHLDKKSIGNGGIKFAIVRNE